MRPLHFWRLFRGRIQRMSVRSKASMAREANVQRPHIYKKTYTVEELIKYFTSNVVYDSSDYIVTSVPQGVKFLNNDRWNDTESPVVCNVCLQDMIPDLCKAFGSEYLFVTKHPRRNASGMLILSRNFKAFHLLRKYFLIAQKKSTRIYTYLAVVYGCPTQTLNKTFRIEQVADGNCLLTEILEDKGIDTFKTVETKYNHQVLDSTEHVSLLKISVSYDLRDCIRHILTQRCFTPVFGDSWSIKRAVNFLFGAPLASDPVSQKAGPYELKADILEKLHLSIDEQTCIPIHAHLYGVKLALRNKSEFFVSVPPPEMFVWTCRQLGLDKIKHFTKCCHKK